VAGVWTTARLLVLAAVLGAIIYAHRSALAGMVLLWDRSPMYSFGYIVPLVSAFLVWTRRDALARLAVRPAPWLGSLLLAGGLLVAIAGHLAGVQVVQQLAFLVAIVAAGLVLFGVTVVKTVWVALAYLLLMIPFWDALTEPLHLPFQKLSAALGVKMLHLIGVPAHQEHVLLYLPNITLEVARACSGVNYVVAVLALGIPLGYLYLPSWWRRLVLIAAAVAIAAVSNSLRVALIGMLSYWDVGSPLHGPFHVLHGLFVSGVGYVVLFAGLRLLAPRVAEQTERVSRSSELAAARSPWRAFSVPVAVGLAAVYVLAGAVPMTYVPAPVRLASPLESLPAGIAEWEAEGALSAGTAWWVGADRELYRRYTGAGRPTVELSIGYFEQQTQGREIVSSAGNPLHRAAAPSLLSTPAGRFPINTVRLRSGGRDLVGVFWYDVDGRVVASRYRAKWLTLWNAAVHGRSNGSMVVVFAEVSPQAGSDAVLDEVRRFAALVQVELAALVRAES
jgi:EpsI family protein